MLKLLKAWMGGAKAEAAPAAEPAQTPPTTVEAEGVAPLTLANVWVPDAPVPLVAWEGVHRWLEALPDEAARATAWAACERAWLAHLCLALGPDYRLRAQGEVLLVSSLAPNAAETLLSFVNRTRERILRVLDGVAAAPAWGHDILLVFDDDETYYRYVAHYYPEAGEFAGSSGMFIHAGCSHFVTMKSDLRLLEPVIAHELTHACLSHLPIPAWLNEGLAVNTEHRLCPPPAAANPLQMQARHRRYWQVADIQAFWSGQSFLRNDEGNELSYDLARILVAHFAADWARFRAFALAAHLDDAGAAAAAQCLGVDLGAAVCALLAREPDVVWAPTPAAWHAAPERGAF